MSKELNKALAEHAEAEAERPEVVAWRYGFSGGIVSDKACLDEWKSGGEYQSLMTVAQHERIVGALRAERDGAIKLLGQSVWQKIERLTQERDAALARVAELEGKLTDWVHEGFRLNEALAVAKAQHSVPDGYRLIRLEHFAAIKAKINPEQVDAYRGRNIYDEDKVYANWNACRSALDEIKDVFQQIDWDAENELAELLAAAPGKEGV